MLYLVHRVTISIKLRPVKLEQAVSEGLPHKGLYTELLGAIFEFGRGLYGNTYTSALSTLTLTPGPLQIFVTGKAGQAWERS